ncbi:DNA recombination protein [Colletotrichum nymphaeae SA-01]|uniref:DNA recombination protein n=1 Tax=Colletotrichum nymphaeae SA-01 TaxID=1460502 RepID=A0A135TVK2_9PEZI|nr:DNA recombination protein [Colletotrichum nymphaeae SA-01]
MPNPDNAKAPPRFKKEGDYHRLIVDGKPFLILGVEVLPSTSSSAAYMARKWQDIKALGLNTVLLAVTWEVFEPKEGQFNRNLVASLVAQAREAGIRVIISWFGSMKGDFDDGKSFHLRLHLSILSKPLHPQALMLLNMPMSRFFCLVFQYSSVLSEFSSGPCRFGLVLKVSAGQRPTDWIKTDPARFPKMRVAKCQMADETDDDDEHASRHKAKNNDRNNENPENGTDAWVAVPTTVVSLFGPELIAAEKTAFTEFVQQIKAADAGYDTILMLQIGSEIGYFKWSRDVCDAALSAFDNGVPADYLEFLVRSGSVLSVAAVHAWEEFADGPEATDELFTTYHMASHINSLAKIAKEIYSVPVIVNADLEPVRGKKHGGPGPETLHLWKLFAPYIDIYARQKIHDDYNKNCKIWGSGANQALLVQAHGECNDNIRLLWSAFGTHGAIGIVLFNIEDSEIRSPESHILQLVTFFRQAVPFLLNAQDQGQPHIGIAAHICNGNRIIHFTSGEFDIKIIMGINQHMGYGLAIDQGNGKLLLFGEDIYIKAKSRNDDVLFTRVLSFRELEIDEQGALQIRRTFNADETGGSKGASILSETPMIAEVQFYGIKN